MRYSLFSRDFLQFGGNGMGLVEALDKLVDAHGWAAVLKALEQIAEAEGFELLCTAIRPIRNLIQDDRPGSVSDTEG